MADAKIKIMEFSQHRRFRTFVNATQMIGQTKVKGRRDCVMLKQEKTGSQSVASSSQATHMSGESVTGRARRKIRLFQPKKQNCSC